MFLLTWLFHGFSTSGANCEEEYTQYSKYNIQMYDF